jgi:hypothetical protein
MNWAHGIFRPLRPFCEAEVGLAPPLPGVYIIYDLAGPIYVGRSATSVRDRLQAHLARRGSGVIAQALCIGAGGSLMFEYEPLISDAQAEAILIDKLGTHAFANLRRETDPAVLFR